MTSASKSTSASSSSSHLHSPSGVAAIAPAASEVALAHFTSLLSLETDCWDVHDALTNGPRDFVLLQTSASDESFAAEHIDGAIHLHHSRISEQTLAAWPADTLFVVYCAGPHCNGADRGAANIASLGRPVKKMIGGKAGWLDEGFSLVASRL
jgi:rhodanese-related sulfurtransferase